MASNKIEIKLTELTSTTTEELSVEDVTRESYLKDLKSAKTFYYARNNGNMLILTTSFSDIQHINILGYKKSLSLPALISTALKDKTWMPEEIEIVNFGPLANDLSKRVTPEQFTEVSALLPPTARHLYLSVSDLAKHPGLLKKMLSSAPNVAHVQICSAEEYSLEEWLKVIPKLMAEASTLQKISIDAPEEPAVPSPDKSLYEGIFKLTNGSFQDGHEINPKEFIQWLTEQRRSVASAAEPIASTPQPVSSSSSSAAAIASIAPTTEAAPSAPQPSSSSAATPFWEVSQHQTAPDSAPKPEAQKPCLIM